MSHPVLRVAAVVTVSAVWALLSAPLAPAAPAPPPAVKLAVAHARLHFHTRDAHADFSALSRRDARWALVDGRATTRERLWAAWLHVNGRGRWELRYFDVSAPFEPQPTRHGRVPCDLYPAFSEPACLPPLMPSRAVIKARIFDQLAPAGKAAKIGALLKNGGYTFSFRPPRTGSLIIEWYSVPKGTRLTAAGARPTLLARGFDDFFGQRAAKITIRLTTAGRRTLLRSTSLPLTARGTFTPPLYEPIVATRGFTITR